MDKKKGSLQKMFPRDVANVPKIRFSGFTEGWDRRNFGEITKLKSASRVHRNEWTATGVPFYRSSDVMSAINGTKNEKAFISEELYEKLSSVSGKLEEGDILVTGGGSVGNPYIVPNNEPLYTKDADLIWIKNQGRFDAYFIYEYFRSQTFREYLGSVSHVGTIAHYTITQLSETPISIPSKAEQKQIGLFFSNLDTLITLQKRKCDKLVNIKKSMLEKMFPREGADIPEVRFTGFTGAWERRKLGDVGVAKSGVGFPNIEQDGKEGIPFFKVSDMNTDGNENELIIANNYVTDEQIIQNRWHVICDVPAIFFAKVGAAVMLNRKRLIRNPFLLDNNTMAYIFDKSIWDCDFGKTLFETIDLTKLTQIGALPSYNASDVEDIEIYIPRRAEQVIIGEYFSNLDNLIALHKCKLKKMKNIKKAMLERMFV